MAFSGNGPVEGWIEVKREEEDGDEDRDLLKK